MEAQERGHPVDPPAEIVAGISPFHMRAVKITRDTLIFHRMLRACYFCGLSCAACAGRFQWHCENSTARPKILWTPPASVPHSNHRAKNQCPDRRSPKPCIVPRTGGVPAAGAAVCFAEFFACCHVARNAVFLTFPNRDITSER